MVVEIAARGADREPFAQYAADELLGGGFSAAARDGEDGDAQRPAVFPGQLLKGLERVPGIEDAFVGGRRTGVVGNGEGGAFLKRFRDEAVAVEVGAPQGEEYRIGLDLPGVGRDAGVFQEEVVKFAQGRFLASVILRRVGRMR